MSNTNNAGIKAMFKDAVVSNKQDWSVDQIKVAFGMKYAGSKRSEIALATGHSVHSVQYVFTTKFKNKTAEEILSYLGVTGPEQLIEFATKNLETQVA